MSAPNQTRELLREWKAARTVRECINERDETPGGTEGSKAITAFMENAKNIVQLVIEERNDSFSIADLAALLELAVSIADDEVSETPAECLPIVHKACRVLKTLRDAEAQEPEADAEDEPPKLSFREVLGPLEDKIGDLATIARLIAAHGTNCTLDPSRYQGKQREREERMLQDVLIGLGFIRDQAESLETFFDDHWAEVSKSWPR